MHKRIILLLILCFVPSLHALRVVTSFSVLHDIVLQVIQNVPGITLDMIVPHALDPHTYHPRPDDSKKLNHADMVFVNGFGFEEWMDQLIDASGFEGQKIIVSKNVQPRPDLADPHVWHNVQHVILYVEEVCRAFCEKDPSHAQQYQNNAQDYIKQLEALHLEIKSDFEKIEVHRRFVVTTHDAFWYFGQAYGVTFISPVGVSTEAEASPQDVARVMNLIQKHHIRAIFTESMTPNMGMLKTIAEQAGVGLQEDQLFSDTLSIKEGPASSYIQMMRHNVKIMMNAMKETL